MPCRRSRVRVSSSALRKPRQSGLFLCSDERGFRLRNRQRVASAHPCPFDRAVVLLAVRYGEPIAALDRLRVDAEGEPWVLVAELVGGVADVVAADAAEARIGAPQRVERDPLERRAGQRSTASRRAALTRATKSDAPSRDAKKCVRFVSASRRATGSSAAAASR